MYFEYRIVKIEKGLFLIEYKTAPYGVWHEVIDKRESVGSHFSIINKGVRTDYNIIFKRIDNGKLFPCKDVEYGDYIQYQLNYKYSITEEDMQRLSGIYNRDFYK